MLKKLFFISYLLICICRLAYSQNITQTVKGVVTDQTYGDALIGATIVLLDSDPLVGATTDIDGTFILENIPVGRQSFEVSMLGYDSYQATEILVSSGKEVILDLSLSEASNALDEIVVVYKRKKDKAINSMATLSSRQFTVEETEKYAGGLNDPARLVSSFAGVATPSMSSNGISVRGNSPAGLLWRVEGVEIPSPNHFADLTIAGAGLLTVLSSQVMGNSDFYTGAFPAEYGNASSGVFDINLRKGNDTKREYTLQAGLIGLDFATEGPFRKGKDASYLFNYRYSTLGLIGSFLPSDAGILKYQDLSYKIHLPTANAGTFSLWGLGAYDGINIEALDSTEWKSNGDRENSQTSLHMFASGLNHRIAMNSKSFLKTSFAISGNGLSHKDQRLNDDLVPVPKSDAIKNNSKITLQSGLTTYLNNAHTNRTGFYINRLGYDLDINQSSSNGISPISLVNEEGSAYLFQFYSQSKFELSPQFTMNVGFHSQYFQLNDRLSFEPRLSFKYQLNEKNNIALAYGLHSKIESLPIYFIKDDLGNLLNKDLDLMKSHHVVLSYSSLINDNIKFTIEPYFQYLTNVPVSPDSYVSVLNIQDNLFFNEALVSGGTGRNFGIDLTVERYLKNGLYFLMSGSIFDAKYTATDGIERNTRFNKNYVLNGLIGKEWQIGKQKNNLLSFNFRLNYLGGNRIESIDQTQSLMNQDIVFGETNNELSFTNKHSDSPIASFTISYRKNKKKYSSVWSLQVLNVTQTEEFETDIFNLNTQKIEQKYSTILVPNLSYKIEF